MTVRSGRSLVFCEVGILKKYAKFTVEAPVLESLFNKVGGLQACNVIKKRLQHMYFLVNFDK